MEEQIFLVVFKLQCRFWRIEFSKMKQHLFFCYQTAKIIMDKSSISSNNINLCLSSVTLEYIVFILSDLEQTTTKISWLDFAESKMDLSILFKN